VSKWWEYYKNVYRVAICAKNDYVLNTGRNTTCLPEGRSVMRTEVWTPAQFLPVRQAELEKNKKNIFVILKSNYSLFWRWSHNL
jgi:hypothetical protein